MGTNTTWHERQMEIDRLGKKMASISAEMDRLGELDELDEGQQERFARLERGFTRAAAERLRLQDEIRSEAVNAGRPGSQLIAVPGTQYGYGGSSNRGPQVSRNLDPWDFERPSEGRNELRSRALTAIERCERLPDAAREVAARNVERDPDPDSRLARYTAVASDPDYFTAFAAWFRDPLSGQYEWTPQERAAFIRVQSMTRAMGLGTGSAGGFLAPYELDPSLIISSAGSVDPMRDVCRVTQTAYNEKRFITTAGVTASWDAEAAEVSDDSPALAQPPVVAFKGAAYVQASYELDEDTDIAREVGALFADAKAQLESNAFTLGSGVGQPKGVITSVSAVGGSVIATGTNVLAQADLFNNQAALPARWRPRARFMMNLSILNGYRQLPQATGLNYSIINDSTTPPTALGWQIRENSAMDGTLGASAADYTVLSGDFNQYVIVDRVGTIVVPIPAVIGPNRRPTGERGWYLHWRAGGDVLVADAFRLTNHSA
ncbi:phage major capsid protein [Micromonospora sp. CA-244673]|uniref:phage major capsid protein n=1 Tax=Micromonospora sp. CA-244673 TaxID=3239958 RepID=UPI003D8BCBE2